MRNKDITLCLTYYSHCMTLHLRAKRQSQYSFCLHMGGTMNRLFLLACCIFTLMGINLLATNHLDIMHIIQGEFNGSEMGMGLASLDFNGDGIKDLVVQQANNPRPEHQGIYEYDRIMVMYGGDNFDTVPDLTIFGNPYEGHTSRNILRAGDVNGDGFDDLVTELMTWSVNPGFRRICVYFGGENPSTTPGYQYEYPAYNFDGIPGVDSVTPFALGDINGDGCSDIGVVCDWNGVNRESIDIIYGGSYDISTIYDTYIDFLSIPVINGLGDVNSDGFADFAIGHSNFNYIYNNSVTLFYGCSDITQCDSLVLVDQSNDEWAMKPMAAGDVNGDGFDDFLGRDVLVDSYGYGYFWYGGTNITSQHDVSLFPDYFGSSILDYNLVHGDLNNDGFEDLIGSQHALYGDDGVVAIWLGKQNFNGVVDLYLRSPLSIPGRAKFGYAMACGDFNNDGIDDLAVGAPQSSPGLSDIPGAVVIYSGNTLLADTTVANEDELAPQLQDQWQFSSFPNPLPAGKSLSLRYLGKGYAQPMTKNITLYNLKGQRVFQTQDSSRGETSSISLPELPSGVYILSISEGITRLSSKRILVY